MADEKRIAVRGAVWRPDDATLVEWDERGTVVTRPWPNPRSWRRSKSPKGRWCEGFGQVHRAGWVAGKRARRLRPAEAARRAAWSTVPEAVRRAILDAALAGEDWPLLSMLARCPGALDLARSVPLLAGILAACRRFDRSVARPLRSIRALLRVEDGMARWRRVAAWLGFDGPRAFVNVLRRVPAGERFTLADVRYLQNLWGDRLGRKRLLHAPRLGCEAVRLLEGARARGVLEQLHPDLVEACAGGGRWAGLAFRFEAAAGAWRDLHPARPLPRWRTGEEVEAAFAELLGALWVEGMRAADLAFPVPPFPPGPGVSPIASPEELVAGGARMRHCLGFGGWDREARLRLGFAYRVEVGHSRGTLWLQRDARSPLGFAVAQLRGPANVAPDGVVVEAVARWLQGLAAAPPPMPEDWVEVRVPVPAWEWGELRADPDIPF